MRLRAITPIRVTEEEIRRRQDRYNRLAPAGIELDVHNLPDRPDVPWQLNSRADILASDYYVFTEGLRTDRAAYDGIFIDCVLDPALEPLAAEAGIPVFGPTRLTLGLMAGLGLRFAGVCRNEAIARAMAERVRAYGYGDQLSEVAVLRLSFDAVSDNTIWNDTMQRVLNGLEERGEVQALINGCSAVDCAQSGGGKVRVVDPVAAALQMIAAFHQQAVAARG